jgi:uncharacterized protein YecT (DUF1311 family)
MDGELVGQWPDGLPLGKGKGMLFLTHALLLSKSIMRTCRIFISLLFFLILGVTHCFAQEKAANPLYQLEQPMRGGIGNGSGVSGENKINQKDLVGNAEFGEQERIRIEKEISKIGQLINKGDYTQANARLKDIDAKYPDIAKTAVSGASERSLAEYRARINQKMYQGRNTADEELFTLYGEVTKKSPQEGSGAFWNFELKTSDGVEYIFTCSATDSLNYKIDNRFVNLTEGYESLKKYPNVALYIKKSKYDYVMNKCRNKGCDGTCPSIIEMHSTATQASPNMQSPPEPLELAQQEFNDADKELNILYRVIMDRLNPDQKHSLKKEQIAWIKRKESTCLDEANQAGPKDSQVWRVQYLKLATKMTEERISQLKKIK